MTHALRILSLMSCLWLVFPSQAAQPDVQRLVFQAKAAIAENDRTTVERLFDEILVLTTGLDPTIEETSEHRVNADYQRKLCPYRKATGPLMEATDIEDLFHLTRIAAFGIVKKKAENAPYVLAIIGCVQDNGKPVPDALALINGIKWAQKLEAANAAETQIMAKEYDDLIKRYPEKKLYQWVRTGTGLSAEGYRLKNLSKDLNKRHKDGASDPSKLFLFQMELTKKADKGDLGAQLDVAHRLEKGDKFKQNNHFAYFWYKRALQNNGGEAAQSGLDRLLPRLDEIDLRRVENWLQKKYRPY